MDQLYQLKAEWTTPEQVSEILDVDVSTVYRWLNSGALKGFQLGKKWRIAESDVLTFVQEEKARQERKIAHRSAWRAAKAALKVRRAEQPENNWEIRECLLCGTPFVRYDLSQMAFCTVTCLEEYDVSLA